MSSIHKLTQVLVFNSFFSFDCFFFLSFVEMFPINFVGAFVSAKIWYNHKIEIDMNDFFILNNTKY